MKWKKYKDSTIVMMFVAVLLLLGGAAWWAYRHYITSPPYVDFEKFPVRGFDISAHNGYANMKAAADAGFKFVWIKASEGVNFRDENFSLNYDKARHAGLKTGAYHYFRFDKDGIEQAVNFLSVVGPRPMDLGLAVDVEDTGNARGVPLDSIRQRLQLMVEYLNMKGHRVTLYSNRDGYEKYIMKDFPGYPLWVCQFTDNSTNSDWTFWQYDHHGHVPGVRGEVDLNVYVGKDL